MTRLVALLALFLLLVIVQTSFFASLPGLLAYTPLVLAAAVYLLQHVGERAGALWILWLGVFLDLLAIPSFPLESISYAAAALVAYLSAQRIFSNRSWYGLIACGVLTVLTLSSIRALTLGVILIRRPERVSWNAYFDTLFWDLALMVVLLSVFFLFARHIRGFLKTTFMLSPDRDTLS
jgi:rod shape-determining protein MreD